jgi:hypothetical protein
MAAMVLYVDEFNRRQDELGFSDEGRAETLLARLSASVWLMKAA